MRGLPDRPGKQCMSEIGDHCRRIRMLLYSAGRWHNTDMEWGLQLERDPELEANLPEELKRRVPLLVGPVHGLAHVDKFQLGKREPEVRDPK